MCVKSISAILILFISLAANAQTKQISYLKTKVDAAKANDEKLAAIIAYCEDYANLYQDSLEKYTYVALELAAKSKDERLKTLARLTLAQDYMKWGWTDSVYIVVDEELPKNPVSDANRRDIYFSLKKLKAFAFGAEGRFKESLEILYPLVTEAEKYNDSLLISSISNMIGKNATSINQLKESRKWNDKALAYSAGHKTKFLGSILINRGQLMYKENKIDSALYFLDKGIVFCKQVEMYDRLASGYRFQSVVYTDLNKLDEAEASLKNMRAARGKIYSRPDAIIDDNLQIAEFYATTGQLKKAIAFCWSKLDSGDYHQKIPGDTNRTFNTDPAIRLPFFLALSRYLKEEKNY